MSKTQRILSYLPPTFRTEILPTDAGIPLLHTVVDAAGQRMLEAEDLLFRAMRAHWVDFSDQGAPRVHDLAWMASLFDLAPRDDEIEDVEAFRIHLKSYIRTYLQGSATRLGVLRLAASTLSLSIEEPLEPAAGDPDFLIDTRHPGEDAALKLFGFQFGEAHGALATPARVEGSRDLSSGLDLGEAAVLQLAIDRDNIATVALPGGSTDLWEVARRVNAALGVPAAEHDSQILTLTSQLTGAEGEIQLGVPEGDASDLLLGLAPRTYTGSDELPAQVLGKVDHAPQGGLPFVNLKDARFLRLAVDGGQPIEVDCAGLDPAATSLDEVVGAVDAAAGQPIASHDGHYLRLASPTTGPASKLELFPAPGNDALPVLLGTGIRLRQRGAAGAAAVLPGRTDLREGVDLSQRRFLHLQLDQGAPQEVDCAGINPAATTLIEIVERLNAAFLAEVASHDGRTLTLKSPTAGAESRIEVLAASDPESDAAFLLLGVAARVYQGQEAGRAFLQGQLSLEEPLDLRRQRFLWLSLDGAPLLKIDVAGEEPAETMLQDIVDALNAAAETTVAFHQDGRLVLQSPSLGAESSIVLRAPQIETRRFFYTRGRVREDAATYLFGFASGIAQGALPEPARLTGTVDLTRGADLSLAHSLRLQVDDHDPLDIRLALPARPRVTPLSHMIDAINAALSAALGRQVFVASDRQGRLELTSLLEGPQGRIAIGASTASDLGGALFGLPPGAESRGVAAGQVRFVGLPDLARGLDVTNTYMLSIGIDDLPVTEIDLRTALPEGSPPILSPASIAAAINAHLGSDYASQDGRRVILTSRKTGSDSQLTLEPAGAGDATLTVFGLAERRTYVAAASASARLVGLVELEDSLDLSERRRLSLEIDGVLLADCDVAGAQPDATTLGEVVAKINACAVKVLGKEVAGLADGRLVVQSPTSGGKSAVRLLQSTAADARSRLLGDVPAVTLGQPGQPAVLQGQAQLRRPVDLSRRSRLRLRVDGGEVREIDCAGEESARTFSDEAIARINAVFPGLAALDDQRRLVLTAAAQVELLAQRYFTLFEFLPVEAHTPEQPVRQHVAWSVFNPSVRSEPFEWQLFSLRGVDRPRLTNRDSRAWVQVNAVIPADYTLHVRLSDDGAVTAWMDAPGRATHDLTGAVLPDGQPVVQFSAEPEMLVLQPGETEYEYRDCYGDRFDSAYSGGRSRRSKPLEEVPAHYAGGQACHTPGVFNATEFADESRGMLTVLASRSDASEPQASVSFVHLVHQAGHFELQLPADLPPRFGGRFNEARFAHAAGGALVYPEAVFDLPEDPKALDEQIKANPGMVVAEVALFPEAGVPVYGVPFTDDRPLTGGSTQTAARLYLFQESVPGFVLLRAKEVGAWGNEITVAAPDSPTAGAFDVTLVYHGKDVFENARGKVLEQVILARAAGVAVEVTRR